MTIHGLFIICSYQNSANCADYYITKQLIQLKLTVPFKVRFELFHGGDYEEWRLLGYKNPVRTSQDIHYVSTTEPSRLMLCKI
jgi:hypothetical protein